MTLCIRIKVLLHVWSYWRFLRYDVFYRITATSYDQMILVSFSWSHFVKKMTEGAFSNDRQSSQIKLIPSGHMT